MNFVPYIFILIPSLIGISFYNKLAKIKNKKFDIVRYFVYVLLSNMFALLFLKYFTGFNGDIYNQLISYSHYSFRYGLILIVFNIVIGFLDFFKLKFFDFEIEEKNVKKS